MYHRVHLAVSATMCSVYAHWRLIFVFALVVGLQNVHAQDALDIECDLRPNFENIIRIDGTRWCLETAFHDPELGNLSLTSLVYAPDGTLYATNPNRGTVITLTDSDGNGFPDTTDVILANLNYPSGLDFYEGALYVVAGEQVIRWADGESVNLIEDLPALIGGFWRRGIAIHPDEERIYVSISAPCDLCVWDNPEYGAILSFHLDGDDKQIVAQGFRFPADLAFHDSDIWTMDSVPSLDDGAFADELSRVVMGDHYGFPFCRGKDNELDTVLSDDFDCDSIHLANVHVATLAAPVGVASYQSDTLADLNGTLLTVFAGRPDDLNFAGYHLAAVHFEADEVMGVETLVPYDNLLAANYSYQPYATFQRYFMNPLNANLAPIGAGIYPNHPFDVAVSPEGWIVLSVDGGTLYFIRPLPNAD